ncbi:hypothetical protein A2U01_0001252 [Trifolium medium]|uniref:Uncharacterized protein n=1 Tax=Trifolium medium TaxID=97028 RepID=A0A392LZQ9_9FABA|nr:hypothetical protein [Trifolium medium]
MAESSNFVQPAIPKFDGYYEHWSMLMENLLRSKEYWGLIENRVVTAPANATAEQHRLADESKLRDLKSLRREFEILAMGEGETVNEYFARTLAIVNRMTSHGERMEQVMVVEKILRSMPSKFNYVGCSIEESNDVTTLSIDELQSSLVHEQIMKGQQDYNEEQALKVSNVGRGRGRNSSRGMSALNGKSANYVEFESEEEMLLMAHSDLNIECKEQAWYLDSGCSNHMVSTKDWLFEFDESFRESVKLGNDSKMAVMGKGNVKLSIEGRVHVITDVYYLPGLGNNLLSVGQLQQRGLTIVFKNNVCQLFHEEKGLILTNEMTMNIMYIIHASMIIPKCLQITKIEETNLWHKQYAHLSIKGLKVLNKKHMVKGLPDLKDTEGKCTDCLSGKQHREIIPKQTNWRASQKLELIHSDICGPINPKSNGGNMYFITFTDDFSRKTWTYFMQEKSLKDITPEKAWSGVKPSVHHFRIFGCLAHVHILDVHRKKLDGKSIKCIHLGVSEESKAYKVYDPIAKKIIVRRDVIFEENKGWNWNKENAGKVVSKSVIMRLK